MAQQLSNQRIAWFNGKFMPEGQVMIPFRDRSWKYGDGAFDMTRTFEGKPFRLKEHIDRFYRSLRYLQIDPGIGPKEMVAHSEEVVARNEHLRPAVGDWWVGQRVSRGVDAVGDEGWDHTGPNAEEMSLPSTSLCILPVKSFNGGPVADGKTPGPITKKLIDAYAKDVGCDFVGQYLKFLQ